ncbi:hypothetical protein Bra471DRAFT_01367 [Bradyrhizobium sp. WSM471]|nr:hypothetical protein Bra471DRAFT_01367 [Bradyrhizobium sp. WSM471]
MTLLGEVMPALQRLVISASLFTRVRSRGMSLCTGCKGLTAASCAGVCNECASAGRIEKATFIELDSCRMRIVINLTLSATDKRSRNALSETKQSVTLSTSGVAGVWPRRRHSDAQPASYAPIQRSQTPSVRSGFSGVRCAHRARDPTPSKNRIERSTTCCRCLHKNSVAQQQSSSISVWYLAPAFFYLILRRGALGGANS